MGLIVKKAIVDNDNDDLKVGDYVKVISNNIQGIIIFSIASLYQVQLEDGSIKSYRKEEIERI